MMMAREWEREGEIIGERSGENKGDKGREDKKEKWLRVL
jgi:hypothetical protein